MNSSNLFRFCGAFAALVALAATPAFAANFTWDGGGANNNWSLAGNWNPDGAPATNGTAALIFQGFQKTTNNNDFTALTSFQGITFDSNAGSFVLGGNSITFTGNITDNTQFLTETIALPMIMSDTAHQISVTDRATLAISGVIGGSGSSMALNKTGNGDMVLSGNNTFTGPLNINQGRVLYAYTSAGAVDTALGGPPGSATPGRVVINGGALHPTNTGTIFSDRGLAVGNTLGGSGTIEVQNGQTTSYGGIISNVTGASVGGGLTKSYFGTLRLYGANNYSGTTWIQNGTLQLDFSDTTGPTPTSQILYNGVGSGRNLIIGGTVDPIAGDISSRSYGQLMVIGRTDATAVTQTFDSTTFGKGLSRVSVLKQLTGGDTTVQLGAVSHVPGAIGLFLLPTKSSGSTSTTAGNPGLFLSPSLTVAAGTLKTTSTNSNGTTGAANGIIGGWAYIADTFIGAPAAQTSGSFEVPANSGVLTPTEFASIDGSGNIVPFTGYTDLGPVNGTPGTNLKIVSNPNAVYNFKTVYSDTRATAQFLANTVANGKITVLFAPGTNVSALVVGQFFSGAALNPNGNGNTGLIWSTISNIDSPTQIRLLPFPTGAIVGAAGLAPWAVYDQGVQVLEMNTAGLTDVNSIRIGPGNGRRIQIGTNNILRLGKSGALFKDDYSIQNIVTMVGTQSSSFPGIGIQNDGTITAGGPDVAGVAQAGELIFNINAAAQANGSFQIEGLITDNPGNDGNYNTGPNGAVTVIKTGAGSMKIRGFGNSYTGGTYLLGGRVQLAGSETVQAGGGTGLGNPNGFGTGPVYVLPGGQWFASGVGAGINFTNPLFLSGAGTNAEQIGAIRMGAGNYASTITLVGDTTLGGGANSGGLATAVITGRITGNYNLSFGGTTVAHNIGLGNPNPNGSAGSNDWTGNTQMNTRLGADGQGLWQLLANEQIPNGAGFGNLLMNANSTNNSIVSFDLQGFNETVNGLVSLNQANKIFIENRKNSSTANLTVGDNNASSTFNGTIRNNLGTGGASGIMSLTKKGTGALTLGGTNTFTGNTRIIDGGVLQLTGNGKLSSTFINVENGTLQFSDSNNNAATDPLAPGVNIVMGTVSNTNALLDLSGADPVLATLSTLGTGSAIITNTSSAAAPDGNSELVLQDGVSTFGGSIIDGPTRTTGLRVRGANTPTAVTLTGTSTGTGDFSVEGNALNSGTLTVNGTVGVEGVSNLLVNSFGILKGNGTIKSTVIMQASDGQMQPGTSVGTLTMGGLTFNSGNIVFEVGTTDALTDKVLVHKSTNDATTVINGGNIAAVFNSGFAIGTYTLITSDTDIVYNTGLNLLFPGQSRPSPSLDTSSDPKKVFLTIAGGAPATALTWTGANGGTTTSLWSVASGSAPFDWTGGTSFPTSDTNAAFHFYNLDSVIFDDTSSRKGVQLVQDVTPGAITVNTTGTGASGYEFFTTNLSTIQGGTILKQGSGELKLSVQNASTGAVTIENGKIILNSTSSLPSGALTLGGGATGGILDMNGFSAQVGGLTKAGSAAASANQVTNTQTSTTSTLTWRGTLDTFNGQINDAAGKIALVVNSLSPTGSLTLNSANSFSGGITMTNGALVVGVAGAINATTPNPVVFNTTTGQIASLRINGIATTIAALSSVGSGQAFVENRNAAAATLTVNSANTETYSGVIQDGTGGGALSISRIGSGTWVLPGSNTYTGTTNIGTGVTIAVTNPLSLGAIPGGAVTINSGATLDLGGTGTNTANAINFGQKQFNVVGTGIGGLGAIVNNDGINDQLNALQRVNLTGATTFGGPGRFDIRAGQVGGANQATLAMGANVLTKIGTGYFNLNAVTVTHTAGASILVTEGRFGLEGPTIASVPITIQSNSAATAPVLFNFNGNGVNTAGASFFSSTVTLDPNGGVVVPGAGGGAPPVDAYPGVSNVAVVVANNNNGSSNVGATWILKGDMVVTNLNAGANSQSNLVLSGPITEFGGSRKVIKTNSNQIGVDEGFTILNLAASNTFTGGLFIDRGIVNLANAGALNSATPNAVTFGAAGPNGDVNGSALRVGGLAITISGLNTDAVSPGSVFVQNQQANPGTLTVNNSSPNLFAGVFEDGIASAALNYVQRGSAKMTWTGANTYTGTTTINAGSTLQLGADATGGPGTYGTSGTLGNGSAAVTLTGNLIVSRSNALSIAKNISGAGTFRHSGDGTTTLSGTNSGFTAQLDNGTVLFNGNSSGVTVSLNALAGSAGTLGGSGTVGAVTIGANNGANAGNVAPGGSIGTLTMGSLTVGGGTFSMEFGTGDPSALGNHDLINVTGTAAFNSASTITPIFLGAPTAALYTIPLINAANVTSSANPTVSIPASSPLFGNPRFSFGQQTVTGATGHVDIIINAQPLSLTWTGATDNSWAVGTTGSHFNWTPGINEVFYNFDSVTFGDGGIAQNNVKLETSVIAGTVTFNNTSGTYTVSSDTNNGKLNGGSHIQKSGAGTAIIATNNTFNGGVNIDAGVLQIGNAGALNSATPNAVTFGSSSTGALRLANTSVTVGGLSTTSTSAIVENEGNALTTLTWNATTTTDDFAGTLRDGTLGGALALAKSGTGALTLSGSNTFTGGVTINDGALQMGSTTALTSAENVSFPSGAPATAKLRLNGNSVTIGNLSTFVGNAGFAVVENGSASPASLTVTSSTNTEFGGTINDGGSAVINLVKDGSSTLTLFGPNGYTGTTTINNGTLQIGNGSALGNIGAGTANIVDNSNLVFNLTSTLSVTNAISGTGNLSSIAAGTIQLGNSNSYSGLTTINNGTVNIGSSASLGDASATNSLAIAAGTLSLTSTTFVDADLTTNRSVALGSTSVTSAGVTLNVGNPTTGGPNVMRVTGDITLIGGVSGTPGLTKTGAGSVVLSGNNNYTGPTTVNQGILSFSGANQIGDSTNAANAILISAAANGGTLQYTGASDLDLGANRTITIGGTANNDGIIGVTGAGALTVSAAISTAAGSTTGGNTPDLQKTGSGKLILAANNSAFTQDVFIQDGSIEVSSANSLVGLNTPGQQIIFSSGGTNPGGTLRIMSTMGNTDIANKFQVNLAASGTFYVDTGVEFTAGVADGNPALVSGTGGAGLGFAKTGDGTMRIVSNNPQQDKPFRLDGGTLVLENPGALGGSGDQARVDVANATTLILRSDSDQDYHTPLRAGSGASFELQVDHLTGGVDVHHHMGALSNAGPFTMTVTQGANVSGSSRMDFDVTQLTGTGNTIDSGVSTVAVVGGQANNVAQTVSWGAGTSLSLNGTFGSRFIFNIDTPTNVTVADNNSTITVNPGATLELAGAKSMTSQGNNNVNIVNDSTTSLHVTGTNQAVGNIDGVGNMEVHNNATITASRIQQASLAIDGDATNTGAVVTVRRSISTNGPPDVPASGLDSQVSVVDNFSFASDNASIPAAVAPYGGPIRQWYGVMDLVNNDMIIRNVTDANIGEIMDMVRSGLYTGGAAGMTSSEALVTGDYAGVTYLGALYNALDTDNDINTTGDRVPIYSDFDGISLVGGEMIIKYTWFGDADLSGMVDTFDATLLSTGYFNSDPVNQALNPWLFGDFDFTGQVDTFDDSLQGVGFFGGGETTHLPEPGSLVLMGVGAGLLGFAGWRKRRSKAAA